MKNKEMIAKKYTFSGKTIDAYFNANFILLEDLVDKTNTILITDENIFFGVYFEINRFFFYIKIIRNYLFC